MPSVLIVGFLALSIIGVLLVAYAWPVHVRERTFLKRAVAVDVKVTEVRVEEDDESRIASPVFTITDGLHAGQTTKSRYGAWPPAYSVGDVEAGLFDPVSGRIETASSVRTARFVALFAILAGIGLLLPTLFLIVRRLI